MPNFPSDDLSVVAALQQWYAAECNGDWEHSYGIVIETLDNPGWSVEIDLEETPLACRAKSEVRKHISEEDWLHIEISDSKFVGAGDPTKLLSILSAFIEFKNLTEDSEL